MKPLLLYLGHYYHQKTASTQFLIDLLSEHFEIVQLGVDPDSPKVIDEMQGLDINRYSLIVLFQVEFLLPIIAVLRPSAKVLCVPMYDACGALDSKYFELLRGAAVLNFSSNLHNKCGSLELETFYWKYYPKPAEAAPLKSISKDGRFLRIFLWIRRPEQVNIDSVKRLFPSSLIEHIHLHWAPDCQSDFDEESIKKIEDLAPSYAITHWFESKSDYYRCLSSCNIFMAPRVYEGIGQSFLDAMAHGLVVCAANEPTHSEYILNWTNGILYDASSGPVHLTHQDLDSLRQNSLGFVHAGERQQARYKCDFINFLFSYLKGPKGVACWLAHHSSVPDLIPYYSNGFSGFIQNILNAPTLGQSSRELGLQAQLTQGLIRAFHFSVNRAYDDALDVLLSCDIECIGTFYGVLGSLSLLARLVSLVSSGKLCQSCGAIHSFAERLVCTAHGLPLLDEKKKQLICKVDWILRIISRRLSERNFELLAD